MSRQSSVEAGLCLTSPSAATMCRSLSDFEAPYFLKFMQQIDLRRMLNVIPAHYRHNTRRLLRSAFEKCDFGWYVGEVAHSFGDPEQVIQWLRYMHDSQHVVFERVSHITLPSE